MNYIGFDTITIWYTGIGFFLWVLAQVTRADGTQGVLNNIAFLLLFVVAWPKIAWVICCHITEDIF